MPDAYAPVVIMIELFSGTGVMSAAFRALGWDTLTVDWDPKLPADLHADIGMLDADTLTRMAGGRPDVVWASPDCTTFSVAAIGHHRRPDPRTGLLLPVSDYATACDRIDAHVMRLIGGLQPCYWFVENPVGGMRKAPFTQGLPRYTVTYCRYGDARRKPTDIWTNHPNPGFRPPCRNGDPCHESAPRGSKTGTQGLKGHVERSRIPAGLCAHIVDICTPPPRGEAAAPPRPMGAAGAGEPVLTVQPVRPCQRHAAWITARQVRLMRMPTPVHPHNIPAAAARTPHQADAAHAPVSRGLKTAAQHVRLRSAGDGATHRHRPVRRQQAGERHRVRAMLTILAHP